MGAVIAMKREECAALCEVAIDPGDEIVYVDDEPVHEGCEPIALRLAAERADEREHDDFWDDGGDAA